MASIQASTYRTYDSTYATISRMNLPMRYVHVECIEEEKKDDS